ncbi:1394_t:CDS:2, partial [Gigaspora rosea]
DKELVTIPNKIWIREVFPPYFMFGAIYECHWRILKRDFLYKFNRPCLDVLCYVIINKMLPKLLHLLVTGRIQPSWRKDFKHEWKQLLFRKINDSNKYLTAYDCWICSCQSFNSLFVSILGDMENSFFNTVQRNNNYPFIFEAHQSVWSMIFNSSQYRSKRLDTTV